MNKFRFMLVMLMSSCLPAAAQGDAVTGCTADELAQQQNTLASFLTLDFAADLDSAVANLFRLGRAVSDDGAAMRLRAE